jgi:hypothetical protein
MPANEPDPPSGASGRRSPTPRQKQALDFIVEFIGLHRRYPDKAELARHLGITPPTARHMLGRLAHDGHLKDLPEVEPPPLPPELLADIERQARAIVVLAIRNGPLEDLHHAPPCPQCYGKPGYARINDEEMKRLTKYAVNRVFSLLKIGYDSQSRFKQLIDWADSFAVRWDKPEFLPNLKPPD